MAEPMTIDPAISLVDQYTPEQVESSAELFTMDHKVRDMLRAFATTLRQQAGSAVSPQMQDARACTPTLHSQQAGLVDGQKFSDDDIRLALDYSRNYATARPDISPTAKEHVLGLCDRLESLLADRAALTTTVAQNTQAAGEELYVEARQCEDCDHLGLNDSSDTNSACGDCSWQGLEPDQDKCPGCGHENCIAIACPECGGRYRFLADRRLYLHAERAREPDGWKFVPIKPTADMMAAVVPSCAQDQTGRREAALWAAMLAAAPTPDKESRDAG